jgi:hypothetical protein
MHEFPRKCQKGSNHYWHLLKNFDIMESQQSLTRKPILYIMPNGRKFSLDLLVSSYSSYRLKPQVIATDDDQIPTRNGRSIPLILGLGLGLLYNTKLDSSSILLPHLGRYQMSFHHTLHGIATPTTGMMENGIAVFVLFKYSTGATYSSTNA